MHLITKLPSDRAIRDALIKEIKTGFQLKKEMERKEELVAAKQAQELKQAKPSKELGLRCVAHMPGDLYHTLLRRYGREEVHSKEFLNHWQKNYPHLSPNKL